MAFLVILLAVAGVLIIGFITLIALDRPCGPPPGSTHPAHHPATQPVKRPIPAGGARERSSWRGYRPTSLEPGRSWWDAPPLSQLSSFGVRSSARLGAQIIRAALAYEAR